MVNKVIFTLMKMEPPKNVRISRNLIKFYSYSAIRSVVSSPATYILQVLLIIFGLSRKPIFENSELMTADKFESVLNTISVKESGKSVENVFVNLGNVEKEVDYPSCECTSTDSNDACKKVRIRKDSVKERKANKLDGESTTDFSVRIETFSELVTIENQEPSASCDIKNRDNSLGEENDQEMKNRRSSISSNSETRSNSGYVIKKIAAPDKIRLWVRDLIIFLLAANASLWVFWSLEDTTFNLYPLPPEFYDTNEYGIETSSIWETINMICLPLSIFFRMHSCACLFEIWSYA